MISQVKICHVHRSLMRKGYCRPCKAAIEKERYHENPQYHRQRKRNASLKKQMERAMAETQCEHDDALAVDDSDFHPSQGASEVAIFFCPDCGDYFDEGGEKVADPTEPLTGGTVKEKKLGTGSAKGAGGIQSSSDDNGSGEMQLAGVSQDVPPVPPKPAKEKLVSRTASGNSKSGAGTTETGSLPHEAWSAVLDGPWKGAHCPNRNLGCAGKMEPFFTIKSEQQGNTYLYRCPECRCQASCDMKLASLKQ